MFTGIIEEVGEVAEVRVAGGNRELVIRALMAPELRIDQSVSHNGVCLTVVEMMGDRYRVTAVDETLHRSTIGSLKPGNGVNLERSMRLGDRLDGHLVQGHVDIVTECVGVNEHNGSWAYSFTMPKDGALLVEKGSVCLDGVSLTVVHLDAHSFSVAVIPFTHEHTTFRSLRNGDKVNVEFDVIGKYVARMLKERITA